MTIWFDMDGTIADLYGVPNWLEMVEHHSPLPYLTAKPLVNLQTLSRRLNKLQEMGCKIGIISWTSKTGTSEYNKQIAAAKMKWLKLHMKSVNWDYVHIVDYGTNKREICGEGILFDDEQRNRDSWGYGAYCPDQITSTLNALIKSSIYFCLSDLLHPDA